MLTVFRTTSTHVLLWSSPRSSMYQLKSSSPRLSVRSLPGPSIPLKMKTTGNSNGRLHPNFQYSFSNTKSKLEISYCLCFNRTVIHYCIYRWRHCMVQISCIPSRWLRGNRNSQGMKRLGSPRIFCERLMSSCI